MTHGFNGSVHSDDGAHVPWSYSTPTSLHLFDAVERQRLREQISQISFCWNLHHIQPAFIPRCLQPEMSRVHVLRQPESLTCGVVHHSWLSHAIVTRVLFPKSLSPLWRPRASTPVDTAAYSSLSHDESDTAFCLLDQNLKSPPLWTSIPPLTERLYSRFAAQSLSVYAMILSDRTPIHSASR